MPDAQGILIGLGVVVVLAAVIAAAIYAHKQNKLRIEALGALAQELGWRFTTAHDRGFSGRHPQFSIFRQGHSRSAYNTLAGPLTIAGRRFDAYAGDYTYKVTSGSGKNRSTTTYRFSYLIFALPFRAVPDLLIRREGVFDKFAGFFGFQDINFESAEFSRRFFVKSADRRFAYDVIHPQMMEFLLTAQPPPLAIDLERGLCCYSDGARCWSPDDFRRHIAFLSAFFEGWPAHLVNQLDTRPDARAPAGGGPHG